MTIEFHGPWVAPRPVSDMIASLDQAALRRLIRSLTKEEFDRLWAALVAEGDIPPADPREQLRWHLQREQMAVFDKWFSDLDCCQKSDAYLRFVTGQDIAEICPRLQQTKYNSSKEPQ